jgi:hypothetical protein
MQRSEDAERCLGFAMTGPGPAPELRDGEMIRAYLDEVARLKSPVRLWIEGSLGAPFETTLEKVSPIMFSTTTTPKLEQGQQLTFSFMLDTHRFTCTTRAVSPGVFRIPLSVVLGERRAVYRVPFERSEPASVFAVEEVAEAVLRGQFLVGRLRDLSTQGLSVALEETGRLSGAATTLKAGDRFQRVCLRDLPFTPVIHCRGVVVHLELETAEPHVALRFEDLAEVDQKHLERLLIPRVPASFGVNFPARKRKVDFADRLGAPTQTRIKAKDPEMVNRVLEGAPAPAVVGAAAVPPALRLRKASKKILFISTHPETPALAEALRTDGFKQVFEARSYQEAKVQAERVRFDLVVLDLRVGSHWGKEIMATLGSHDLLLDALIILMADYRNDAVLAVAEEVGASIIHERRKSSELLTVVQSILLA